MKDLKLDDYEQDILNSVENDEWHSTGTANDDRERLKLYALNTQKQMKSIQIDLNEQDFHQIKKKSLEAGIPYQTLISSLIHNYVTGKITLTL